MLTLTRRQVLVHRIHQHELDRRVHNAADLRVFDLGIQDTANSAALSLAARLDQPDTSGFATTWTVRGAPHLHRPADLTTLARQLWPWSDADAQARMIRPYLDDALGALRTIAKAMRAIVRRPMTKGEISTALTPKAPDETVEWCRSCDADHVADQIFRMAALPAGLRILPEERTITFERIPKWTGPPKRTEGFGELVRAYLTLHGPAGPSEVASYFGTTPRDVKTMWPESDDLVDVSVEGRRAKAWLPAGVEVVDADPPKVRLLPPFDPYLQARDRDLLVPDKGQQKDIFRVLGRRGVVLVDGEVAGSWQGKVSGKRFDVVVNRYRRVPNLDEEAERLAAARGLARARVETATP